MDALVLSGGGINGAWQAGATEAVMATGFRPEIITGISVGALNAAFLAAYPNDGRKLAEFWETQVTSPGTVVHKRPWYELVYRVLFKKWDGVVSTKPLDKLVRGMLGPHFPKVAGPDVRVGSVNLETGELVYTPAGSPDFLDAVLASAAEPIALPLRRLGGAPHYDGGLRDIAPLKQAIIMGATRIVAVVCQPANVGTVKMQEGNLMALLTRVLGITVNEMVKDDLGDAERINMDLAFMADQPLPPSLVNKKRIDLTVIRRSWRPEIDLESFTHAEILLRVQQGREDAKAVLEEKCEYCGWPLSRHFIACVRPAA